MKRQTHRSFILPYILILVGSIILSAVIIPPAVRATYAQAAESGLPPDFKLIQASGLWRSRSGGAVVASGIYSRRN